MSVINFECKECKEEFNCEVGKISFPIGSERPHFEKDIICKKCGILTMDEVWLTELGQTQLTELHLKDMRRKGRTLDMMF